MQEESIDKHLVYGKEKKTKIAYLAKLSLKSKEK